MAKVHLRQRRLSEYSGAAGAEALGSLRSLAEPLAGLRVLHLTSSPFGSAIADTLAALVPLERDLGLIADWELLRPDNPRVWAALYHGLAGGQVRWNHRERCGWQRFAQRQAKCVSPGYDFIVAHDPQAVALAEALPSSAGRPRWIWHCSLDTRAANPEVWADLQHALQPYAGALFPSSELLRQDCSVPWVGLARPAIDPCSPKNVPLSLDFVEALLGRLGVDPTRPVVGQFGPFDQRYSPMAALGAYWLARPEVPDLELLLVDISLVSSERGRRHLEEVAEAAAGDPDIHLLTAHAGLGATEINVLQRGVSVVLQLSVPSGFGWGLAECQWKGKPGVVGTQGLMEEQVGNGASGFIAEGAPDAATAVVRLLRDPLLAAEMGLRGRHRVASHYLIPGLLGDFLHFFHQVLAGAPVPRQFRTPLDRKTAFGRFGVLLR